MTPGRLKNSLDPLDCLHQLIRWRRWQIFQFDDDFFFRFASLPLPLSASVFGKRGVYGRRRFRVGHCGRIRGLNDKFVTLVLVVLRNRGRVLAAADMDWSENKVKLHYGADE